MSSVRYSAVKTLIALILAAASALACDPSKAKSLIPDVNPCGAYRELGRDTAEEIWTEDWQAFAPLWATEPDAEADEQYCLSLLNTASLPIGPATPERAALVCRAAALAVATARMGPELAALTYANPAGRLAMLATAHALGNALLERHGRNALAAMEDQVRNFAELYKMPEVTTTCIRRYFHDVRSALRTRGGV